MISRIPQRISLFSLSAAISLAIPIGASAATHFAAGPALAVDANAMRHPINPDIYGVTIFWNASASNYAALRSFAQQIGLPANRYGGDGTTRYNWSVDSANAGSDWYFVAGTVNRLPWRVHRSIRSSRSTARLRRNRS